MAHIDDLVKQVADPQLRAALMQQVSTLTSRKQFGLVFQEHSPESVRLPQQRVRTGGKVQLRESKESATFHVISTKASLNVATVVELDESGETVGEPQDMSKSDLVVIKPFGDPVYPGLRQVGEAGSAKPGQPTHVVINGENYHALQALEYTHVGKVDVVYIDPPYNTGNSDWKYNDKYIDDSDSYRHSRWLSFMARRLAVAKRLLNDSGLIFMSIGIDEHHRLRMLSDQIFGEKNFVASISRLQSSGKSGRDGKKASLRNRLDFVLVYAKDQDMAPALTEPVDAEYAKRFNEVDDRGRYTSQTLYKSSLDSMTTGINQRYWIECPDGSLCIPPGVDFPEVRKDGERFTIRKPENKRWRFSRDRYIQEKSSLVFKRTKNSPLIDENGNQSNWNVYVKQYLEPDQRNAADDLIMDYPNTQGTYSMKALGLADRFPFTKPVDLLKYIFETIDNPKAIIVDFFAGSGTTAEAVIRLNAEDGGTRQAILVTNNEVSKREDASLRKDGFAPGDSEYERFGVFHHVTMPRISTVLTGVREDGSKYSDGIDGQYAVFFDLTYEDENLVALGNKFESIAPLLWMQSGATGELIAKRSDIAKGDNGYSVPKDGNYAVIFDTEASAEAIDSLHDEIKKVFIVTDSENDFKAVTANLPGGLKNNAQRLYSSYLRSFEINR